MTSTTTFIAELFICGIMSLIWVALGLLTLLGIEWVNPAILQGWEVPLGAVGVALAYTMGVLVVETADQLLKGWNERIKNAHVAEGLPTVMHLMIAAGSPRLEAWFDYSRSRIRVCRSAALNFTLIALAGLVFVFTHPASVRPHGRLFCALTITLAGGSLSLLALAGWRWSTLSFYKMQQRGPELVKAGRKRRSPLEDS